MGGKYISRASRTPASNVVTSAKPFVQACEHNKVAIGNALGEVIGPRRTLLEIGSGTGQHAVYLAEQFPQLSWYTSDLPARHPGIRAWLDDARLPNCHPPIALDVTRQPWPVGELPLLEMMYSANTAHILDKEAVAAMFAGANRHLGAGGLFLLYGPFNDAGRFTSPGNARLDAYLKSSGEGDGLKDFDCVIAIALEAGLKMVRNLALPANNHLLVWEKFGADALPAGCERAQ